MLHEYHVIYRILYYPRFHVTAVGLGMYYLWILGPACTFTGVSLYVIEEYNDK